MKVDLLGQRFGRLTVLAENGRKGKHVLWLCQCDCGALPTVQSTVLRRGTTFSCGCLGRELVAERNRTHGASKTRAYDAWHGMRQRCLNPNAFQWRNYGGRGIAVCERWQTFEPFYADMGDPSPGMSLDRIDNNGNYEPSNCRWATTAQQSHNRRNNVFIEFNGRAQTLGEWATEIGLNKTTLQQRYRKGEIPPYLFRPADPVKRTRYRSPDVHDVARHTAVFPTLDEAVAALGR